ncbi:MAG: hypothetical protein IH892_17475 [Planctomycetes bacterium]|nr:hypothetical protein [Planctomycetota bacterium]
MKAINTRLFFRVAGCLLLGFPLGVLMSGGLRLVIGHQADGDASTDSQRHLHGQEERTETRTLPSPGLDYDLRRIQEVEDLSKAIDKTVYQVFDLQWNVLEMSTDFSEYAQVETFVHSIPVAGEALLSVSQIAQLRKDIATLLYLNGTEDRRRWFEYLFDAGETLTSQGRDLISGLAEKEGKADWMDLEPLDQLLWYFSSWEANWKGLVAEGSRMKVFRTETAEIERPANRLMMHRPTGKSTYERKTAGPVSIDDQLMREGSVLMADVEVLVKNHRGMVRPYVARYWFDSENGRWRLQFVIKYSRKQDHHGSIVI